MTVRPILFSGPMIRALLDGRKTQTRRVLAGAPHDADAGAIFCDRVGPTGWQWTGAGGAPRTPFKPPYVPGDRLWCRETWSGARAFKDTLPTERHSSMTPDGPLLRDELWFWADGDPDAGDWEKPRPGIHMPRWASRLTLEVTDVRVQRVQAISASDCRAEGHPAEPARSSDPSVHDDAARDWYMDLWDSLNSPRGYGWDANPWVVAITFILHRENVEAVLARKAVAA